MFKSMFKKVAKSISFDNGKLVNSSSLEVSKIVKSKNETKEETIEGVVKNIKRCFSTYYLVTLEIKDKKDNTKTEFFRIYDIIGDLFHKTVEIEDKITCLCTYNDIDSKGNPFNKIKNFNKLEENHLTKVEDKEIQTHIFEGTITNTLNTRDKKKKRK